MYQALDTDSHVCEGELTFSDKYWDPRFRGRRPVVVESDPMGNLSFIIDSVAFPKVLGPGFRFAAAALSKNGVPSAHFRRRLPPGSEIIDPLDSAEFRSAKARIAELDRSHLAWQVNYPSMFLCWPMAYDPALGCALARSYNDWVADISSQAPDRLKWVTVIDPADPKEAAKEIERTKQMGSVGVMLLGAYGDKWLDDPSLEPIWATAAAVGLPVAVHAGLSSFPLDSLCPNFFDALTIAFSFNLLLGFHAVMRSGLLDRYPSLRVAFLEGGARWVDYLVKRIAENSGRLEHRTAEGAGARVQPTDPALIGGTSILRPIRQFAYKSELLPEEYIQRGQVYVNCEIDEAQLPFVVQEYGADFLIFAGDMPHAHRMVNPVKRFMARQDLSEETKRKILVDNGARFYGLPVPDQAPEPARARR
jgi:hypothetical protein